MSVAGVRAKSNGQRVLVLEDEALIAGLIESILSEAGYSVVGPVATAERALKAVGNESFEVALLDVRIDGFDAYSVADALAARGIPFAFVSGFSRDQMPADYRHCAYISKPFEPKAILALVHRMIGRAH